MTPQRVAAILGTDSHLDDLIDWCADKLDVDADDLRHPSGPRSIQRARHAVVGTLRALDAGSLPAIGRALGNRDHTTIHNSAKRARLDAGLADLVAWLVIERRSWETLTEAVEE